MAVGEERIATGVSSIYPKCTLLGACQRAQHPLRILTVEARRDEMKGIELVESRGETASASVPSWV